MKEAGLKHVRLGADVTILALVLRHCLLTRRFRNLEYLEVQLDKYSSARQAEAEEADRWGGQQRLVVGWG